MEWEFVKDPQFIIFIVQVVLVLIDNGLNIMEKQYVLALPFVTTIFFVLKIKIRASFNLLFYLSFQIVYKRVFIRRTVPL